MAESSIVLKQKKRMSTQGGVHRVPVNRIGKIDVEIRDDRLSLNRHVCRRRKVSAFDVLQLIDQSLLRRATGARIPFNGALVDHQSECKTRVSLGFGHDGLRCLINRVVGTVPVDDYAIDPAADHIVDLVLDLPGVGGVVTDIHVLRASEPEEHVGVNLRRSAGIKQRVNIDFTYISSAAIAIRLIGETVGRAGIVGGLSGQRRGGHHVGRTGQTYGRHRQNHCCYCRKQTYTTHRSSGAE